MHEEIGRGGMATVYRATDTMLARQVAVKVLHPHLSIRGEPEFVAQFLEMERPGCNLGARMQPQLAEDVADVGVCCSLADHQRRRDLAVAQPPC